MQNILGSETAAYAVQDTLILSAIPGTLGGAALALSGSNVMRKGLLELRDAKNEFEQNRGFKAGVIGLGMIAVGIATAAKAGNDLFNRLNERLGRA